MLQQVQRPARLAAFRHVAPGLRRGPWAHLLTSRQVPMVPLPLLDFARGYAKQPPSNGGQNGGFPGFSAFGQQHQKGDALQEYVRLRHHARKGTNRSLNYFLERRFN
jgi:hypothetical protein